MKMSFENAINTYKIIYIDKYNQVLMQLQAQEKANRKG